MIDGMTSERPKPDRPTLIADAAIALITERGLRGLTHRAVDEAAGLPTGSTSNLARTRAALLELAITRIAELETQGLEIQGLGVQGVGPQGMATAEPVALPDGQPEELLVELIAGGVYQALTTGRMLTIARYELALEATRRPELRAVYDRLGGGIREFTAVLLAKCGSAAPDADAWRLLRWCDGLLFDSTVGSGSEQPPELGELRTELARYLEVLLGCGS